MLWTVACFVIGYVTLAAAGYFGPSELLPTRAYELGDYLASWAAGWVIVWGATLLARAVRRVRRVPMGQQYVGDRGDRPGQAR